MPAVRKVIPDGFWSEIGSHLIFNLFFIEAFLPLRFKRDETAAGAERFSFWLNLAELAGDFYHGCVMSRFFIGIPFLNLVSAAGILSLLLTALFSFQSVLSAQLFPGQDAVPETQTTGGIFLWQDVLFFQEWHIQHSILTGEYRLLDPAAVCRAAGSREFCEKVLTKRREQLAIPPMSGKILVLLHGFASGPILLENMALWFRKQGEYSAVINAAYPSLFLTVGEQVEKFDLLIRPILELDKVEKIDFVGHSMGAIVLRCWLGKWTREDGTSPADDPKIGRLVQLCPPNQGSSIAMTHNMGPIGLLFAPLDDLSMNGKQMKEKFGIPKCDFGVIAGVEEGEDFYGEESDAVLPVSTTHLDGEKDWMKIKGSHSAIPNRIETFENVRAFLNDGKFL